MKQPVKTNPFSMAKQALLFMWVTKKQGLAILGIPIFASVVTHLLKFIPLFGEKLSFIASFSSILMASFLSVYWYRLALLGEKRNPPIIPFRFGPLEMKYAFVQALFGISLTFLTLPGVSLILKSLELPKTLQLQDIINIKIVAGNIPYLIGGIIYVMVIQLMAFKFSFIFPHAALGKPIKLGEAWNQTNGITSELAFSTLLVILVPLLIAAGVGFVVGALNKIIFHSPLKLISLISLLGILQYCYTLFVITITSLYYEYYVNPNLSGRPF